MMRGLTLIIYDIMSSLGTYANRDNPEDKNICIVLRDIKKLTNHLDKETKEKVHHKLLTATSMAKRMGNKLKWYKERQ